MTSPGGSFAAPRALGVWPWWYERQADPASPDFVPDAGDGSPPRNLTHRSWALVGNLGVAGRAAVDPRGLVAPAPTWSLDWWIGADDRWHLPSRDAAVRQRLLHDAPVVETAMRIPGGDAVQRVYGVVPFGPLATEHRSGVVVVELENRSPVPFVLALAVRPCSPVGFGRVDSLRLEGTTIFVDGRAAVLLPRSPARAVASSAASGDVLEMVVGGSAPVAGSFDVEDSTGQATAAVLFPLAHTAVLRVALPLGPSAPKRRRPVGPGRTHGSGSSGPAAGSAPSAWPTGEQVAKGWEAQTRRGLRLTLPDPRLSALIDAARRDLLLAVGEGSVLRWPDTPAFPGEAADVLVALDEWGFDPEARDGLLSRLTSPAALDACTEVGDGPGALLHALATHWRLTRDEELAAELMVPTTELVRAIARRIRPRRGRVVGTGIGLLGPAPQPASIGGSEVSYRDTFFAVVGLGGAVEVLRAAGQSEVAAQAAHLAEELRTALDESMAAGRERLGTAVLPAGPGRPLDGGVAANLVAGALDLLGLGDPFLASTATYVRRHLCFGPAVLQDVDRAGLSPRLTAELGRVELRAVDPRAVERLGWLVDIASSVATWPTVVHPRTGDGSQGEGHNAASTAGFLLLVRDLLVRERVDGLALCSVWPEQWLGRGVEVHDAPTAVGLVSFAVRWHGERPALLWDLTPHPGLGPVTITAPGLDLTWSTTEPRGEALLHPVPIPGRDDVVPDVPAADAPPADAPPADAPPADEASSGPLPEPGGSFG